MRAWLGFTSLLVTLVMGCAPAPSADDAGRDASPEDAFDPPFDGPDTGPLNDSQILGVLHTIHRTEIQLARLAAMQATRADVLAYASEAATEHMAADDALSTAASSAGILETSSSLSREISGNWMSETQTLQAGTFSFDFVYVDYELGNHARAIASIEGLLLGEVTSPQLQHEVESTHEMEIRHRADAQALFPDTGVLPGDDGGPSVDAGPSFDANVGIDS